MIRVNISDKHDVYDARVFALGIIIYQIGLFKISKSGDNSVNMYDTIGIISQD